MFIPIFLPDQVQKHWPSDGGNPNPILLTWKNNLIKTKVVTILESSSYKKKKYKIPSNRYDR